MSSPGSGDILKLNITVNEEDIKGGAIEILKELRPSWKEEDMKFMNFTEGITNKLIGCYQKTDTEKEDGIVMRIYGAQTDLIIDREMEIRNMQILHAAKCAAACYARFNNGIAYAFVPGCSLDADNIRTPKIYELVAGSMAAMHNVDPTKLDIKDAEGKEVEVVRAPCIFPKIRKYLSLVPDKYDDKKTDEKFKKDIPSKAVLSEEIDRMEKVLTALDSPVVFCHNDILIKNIVYNESKEKITFIDYEYGAYNYELYDIGNHFDEWAGVDTVDYALYPSREVQLAWLRSYLTQKAAFIGENRAFTALDIEKMYVKANKFALLAHLFWGIWALIQAKYSSIDFDYLDYGKIRLDEYFAKRDAFLALPIPE